MKVIKFDDGPGRLSGGPLIDRDGNRKSQQREEPLFVFRIYFIFYGRALRRDAPGSVMGFVVARATWSVFLWIYWSCFMNYDLWGCSRRWF